MGGNSCREMMNPYAVNTPLMAVCVTSLLFNSVQGGTLRSSNVYNNFIVLYMLGFSTGMLDGSSAAVMRREAWPFGLFLLYIRPKCAASVHEAPFSRLHTLRHRGTYMTYHALQWYRETTYFEDAMEDDKDS
ncbi:hypothetical protein TraAM80_08963 [Trypanosoma rangeli]|uniref:Uncharacterized protein n=1 Tax=Trypanosoma rangeli TaxID=5698 RepID=A0A422MY14_TRYRA|nr:uncharacterized protein TraAM80_08963 [Trypanosoma rangeli]RNE98087.1 hypothetical protein TraAM80_08963 [Trypanosoma rangeli]|eukprot:RNE98087.1 hypothetical protein TraAM80_08963 [Trypanosoma rangeli]